MRQNNNRADYITNGVLRTTPVSNGYREIIAPQYAKRAWV